IEHKMVTRAILSAQTQVEEQNFEIRKNILKYDEVMNEQRKVIYAERRRVLEGEDLHDQVQHMITDVVTAYTVGATENGYVEDWDLEQLWTALKTLYPVKLDWHELVDKGHDSGDDLSREELEEAVLDDARSRYADREAEIDGLAGEGQMRDLERRVMLTVLDRKWREHLYEMDYLKEGISLRAMAQRDPLVEYQREGFDMFNGMLDALKEESVGYLFNLQIQVEAPPEAAQPAASEIPGAARPANGQAPAQPANGQANGQAARQAQAQAQAQARRTPPPPPPAPETQVPAALRGKGLGAAGGPQRLNYSGPAESGGVQKQREAVDEDAAGGATRRERREQARAKAKNDRKGSRR
ncbi:MAG TPA: preprotein translocase subunit SecA, partial [Pseudonocardiaceae bacterium]